MTDKTIILPQSMTLAEYLDCVEYPVIYFYSTAGPQPRLAFFPEYTELPGDEWMGLEGTLDKNGAWGWGYEGKPTDYLNNSVLYIVAYDNEKFWQSEWADYCGQV